MKHLIQDFLDNQRIKRTRSGSTIANYEHYLATFADFAGDITPDLITLDLVDAYQKDLSQKVGQSTVYYHLTALRVFLRWLRVRKDLDTLDPDKIELPQRRVKLQDNLTDKETKALLSAASPYSHGGMRDRAILEVLLCSGVRVGELVKILIADIDFENKRFIVHNGKGGKDRICYLTDSALLFVKKYLATREDDLPYLFLSRNKCQFISRSIQRLVRSYAKAAGITKKVTPHSLRRTFGATMLRRGVDMRYIKEFLGHSSVITTQLYTKVENVELENKFRVANKPSCRQVELGARDEAAVIEKENLAKLRGELYYHRKLLKAICEKLEITI